MKVGYFCNQMLNEYIDTHAHLYLEAFSSDIDQAIDRAVKSGVKHVFLPNLDSSSISSMTEVCKRHPEVCYPMMGLHPTSVKENFEEELSIISRHLKNENYIAVGEIGIDLYWDKTFIKEQQSAFRTQLHWAAEMGLPVVIHARDSFDEIFQIMDEENIPELRGVFHSFTGSEKEAEKVLSYDFYIGINGIVTFKNAELAECVKNIPPEKLLIETDAPFLAPVPFRGKRNESAYVIEVAKKIAEIHHLSREELAKITTANALQLFTKVKE